MNQESFDNDNIYLDTESLQSSKSYDPVLKKRKESFIENQFLDQKSPDYIQQYIIQKKFITHQKQNMRSGSHSIRNNSNSHDYIQIAQELKNWTNQYRRKQKNPTKTKNFVKRSPSQESTSIKKEHTDDEYELLNTVYVEKVSKESNEDIIGSENDETENGRKDYEDQDIKSDEYNDVADNTSKDTGENQTIQLKRNNKDYQKEYRKEYYKKNIEKIRERKRGKNKGKYKEYQKEYYRKNRKWISELKREYNKKNKEKERLLLRAYYIKNREKYLKRSQKSRNKNKENYAEFTKNYKKSQESKKQLITEYFEKKYTAEEQRKIIVDVNKSINRWHRRMMNKQIPFYTDHEPKIENTKSFYTIYNKLSLLNKYLKIKLEEIYKPKEVCEV